MYRIAVDTNFEEQNLSALYLETINSDGSASFGFDVDTAMEFEDEASANVMLTYLRQYLESKNIITRLSVVTDMEL